jgi:hypothetical protein
MYIDTSDQAQKWKQPQSEAHIGLLFNWQEYIIIKEK